MIIDVKSPVLAESIAEATLLEWKKSLGERIKRDEILIEIETDKVVLEVPAPADGRLTEIAKGNGETVGSDELIARVDCTDAAVTAPAESAVSQDDAARPEMALSPAVRKLVVEKGLDATQIPASGKDGRITKGDVLDFLNKTVPPPAAQTPTPASAEPTPVIATTPPPAKAAPEPPRPTAVAATGARNERRVPMTRIRQRIAERLVQAQHTAAILTTFNEVNMKPVMDLRSRYKDRFEKTYGVRLGFMSFFAKAAVVALQRFPEINAYIEGKEIIYHDYCDIGIAVGSPRGLVVPVLRNVETMTYADIEAQIGEFGRQAKEGSLGIDDMVGGTFTISNGGVFGSMLSTPILNPPQSAILGMHKTQQRPVVEDGEIVIRPVMYLALSYDHRIVDGSEAVRFLVTIKEGLEDPGRMLLGL